MMEMVKEVKGKGNSQSHILRRATRQRESSALLAGQIDGKRRKKKRKEKRTHISETTKAQKTDRKSGKEGSSVGEAPSSVGGENPDNS